VQKSINLSSNPVASYSLGDKIHTKIDPIAQKAYVIDKIAQQTINAPGGGQLVQTGEVITQRIANAAAYLDVLDELYHCCQPVTTLAVKSINTQTKTSMFN
jgi:hypothetical protein